MSGGGNRKSYGPIFIVGAPRSGTTLLASLLNAHPHIAIPPEEDFLIGLLPRFARSRNIDGPTIRRYTDALCQSDTFRFLNLSKESLDKRLQSRQHRSYAELAAQVYLAYAE